MYDHLRSFHRLCGGGCSSIFILPLCGCIGTAISINMAVPLSRSPRASNTAVSANRGQRIVCWGLVCFLCLNSLVRTFIASDQQVLASILMATHLPEETELQLPNSTTTKASSVIKEILSELNTSSTEFPLQTKNPPADEDKPASLVPAPSPNSTQEEFHERKTIASLLQKNTSNFTETAISSNFTETAISSNFTETAISSNDSKMKITCDILLYNRFDFHYEVIESIAMRYPLPEAINCTHFAVDISLPREHPQYAPGEQREWRKYFQNTLRGSTRTRPVDGKPLTFRNIGSGPKDMYRFIIGVTCDAMMQGRLNKWLDRDIRRQRCVMHGTFPQRYDNVSCWLNPMFQDLCFFIPVDLPGGDPPTMAERTELRLARKNQWNDDDNDVSSGGKVDDTVNICTRGKSGHTALLAKALHEIQASTIRNTTTNNTTGEHPGTLNSTAHRPSRFRLLIFHRSTDFHKELAPFITNTTRQIVQEPGFVEFHAKIRHQCDIYIPLLDPETTSKYFVNKKDEQELFTKKLSGSISLIIGHGIPSVLAKSLDDIYHPYLTAPATVYADPVQKGTMDGSGGPSLEQALREMLDRVLLGQQQPQQSSSGSLATTIQKNETILTNYNTTPKSPFACPKCNETRPQ